MLVSSKKLCIFAPENKNGALAHLARALDWQSKGDEFESRMLHKRGCVNSGASFFYNQYINPNSPEICTF